MKRLFPIILALLFVVTATGCINITIPTDNTDAPTEEPVVTEEPTEAPTEEPVVTEAPTEEPVVTDDPAAVTGIKDFCQELAIDSDNILDLEFDGIEDTVYIEKSVSDDGWDDKYVVTVTLGKDPSKPYVYTVDYCYDFYAWVVDCDPDDSRLDILITFAQDSDDWTSAAMRVNKTGSGIVEFEEYVTISSSIDSTFTSEGGFFIYDMTDIFGSHTIVNYMKVTYEGFVTVEDDFLYWGYPDSSMELLKKFDVRILNDDGSLGETVTLKKGAKVYPYRTDQTSYVIVELADGRKAWIEVEVHNWPDYEDWGYYLNGVNQDELFDVIYAD